MKKKLFKARLKLWFKNFFNNKLAVALTTIGILLTSLGLVLLSWHLEGKDVLAILASPLFMFWYAVIVVGLVSAIYFVIAVAKRKR